MQMLTPAQEAWLDCQLMHSWHSCRSCFMLARSMSTARCGYPRKTSTVHDYLREMYAHCTDAAFFHVICHNSCGASQTYQLPRGLRQAFQERAHSFLSPSAPTITWYVQAPDFGNFDAATYWAAARTFHAHLHSPAAAAYPLHSHRGRQHKK